MSDLLARLQRNLAHIASRDREHVDVWPFDAYIDPVRTAKYFSFALPEPGAGQADLAVALPRLRAAFAQRGRVARTEFAESLNPGLAAALVADGWTLSERMPVMTCTPADLVTPPPVPGVGVEPVPPDAPDDLLRAFLAVQREAFEDDSPITGEELTRWRARASTSFNIVAVESGAVVGTAFAAGVEDGVTEVGGVATLPAARGRGIAGAATAAVTAAAFAAGAEVAWLTASGDRAQGIYARAGFADAGTLLAYDAPASG